jgi:hypothetical protein
MLEKYSLPVSQTENLSPPAISRHSRYLTKAATVEIGGWTLPATFEQIFSLCVPTVPPPPTNTSHDPTKTLSHNASSPHQ